MVTVLSGLQKQQKITAQQPTTNGGALTMEDWKKLQKEVNCK